MKRIDVRNSDLLGEKGKKFTLSRKVKVGVIIAATIVGIYGLSEMNKNNDYNNPPANIDQYEEVSLEDPIEVSLNNINEMNIIINDNDCSDTFMEAIYNKLENDGINFTAAKNSKNIDIDNSVVITLDQQYISGPGMIVIAPYDNNRKGNSDALALACDTAFYEKGFLANGIECGIRGYRENSDGTILERIPTKTEDSIDSDKNVSFVTIAFGTDNTNSDLVVSSIENALARYYSFIKTNNIGEDLIYRSTKEDTIESICVKYGTNENNLRTINNIQTDNLPVNSTIKNPAVQVIREFNRTVPVDMYIEKTKWSK